MGLRQQIAQAKKLPREALTIEELGGLTVWVREMTAAEYDAYQSKVLSRASKDGKVRSVDGLRAMLVQLCLVDEEGAQVYDAKCTDEIQSLPTTVLDTICEAATRINKLDNASDKELEKNFDEGAGDGSPTPSLLLSGEPVESC